MVLSTNVRIYRVNITFFGKKGGVKICGDVTNFSYCIATIKV